jgi:hypothetical protein
MLTPGSMGWGLGAMGLGERDISTRPLAMQPYLGTSACCRARVNSSADITTDDARGHPSFSAVLPTPHRTGKNAYCKPDQNSESTLCPYDPTWVPRSN